MKNNVMTDIAQDLNFDSIEKSLKMILDEGKNHPDKSIVFKLIGLGDNLNLDIELLEYLIADIRYFGYMKEYIIQHAIPRLKSLYTKIFKLAIENIRTDDDILDCKMHLINERRRQPDEYILFLEKVLNTNPDTSHLDAILDDIYEQKVPLTHSDAERISSILNYPIPACRGNFSLLPTER